MPRTIASKSSKSSESSKSSKSRNTSRLEHLLNNISNNRLKLVKSDINLPARLMASEMKSSKIIVKPQIYSKSISSSFSSAMHNGRMHSVGKQVINDSSKPYIQVAELHNGHLEKYMIPRNQSSSNSKTIAKTKKTKKTKKSKKSKK